MGIAVAAKFAMVPVAAVVATFGFPRAVVMLALGLAAVAATAVWVSRERQRRWERLRESRYLLALAERQQDRFRH